MLNRPGDGLKPLRKFDAADATLQVRDWAVQALRRPSQPTPARPSDFELSRGMTTITPTVETAGPSPTFTAKLWDIMHEHTSDELSPTLAQIRHWCDAAVRR
jgi:hypothetical protein